MMRPKGGSLEAAVKSFTDALEQASIAWGQVLWARSEWFCMYEKIYGELVALKGKREAENYFKKATKRKKKPATELGSRAQ